MADVEVERVAELEAWRYGFLGNKSNLPAARLTAEPWEFADDDTRALFDRVRAACGRELDDVAEIFVGVQTSNDSIYIFRETASTPDTLTLRWQDQDWPIERGIVLPCLHDGQLFAYMRAEANAWMIFPYEIVPGARGEIARLIQPADMAARYPLALAYLNARRDDLEKRNIVGGLAADRQFYQFGRSQSLTKFNSPKIILPILSLEARYAYDEDNIVMTGGGNGPYYLVRPRNGVDETNHFLLAVLHHPLCEAMVRMKTSTFRGGYYSHGKQFIKHLPVPVATFAQRAEIEGLVADIIVVTDALKQARSPHQQMIQERRREALRTEIEERVTVLFGLTAADRAVVTAVPIPV